LLLPQLTRLLVGLVGQPVLCFPEATVCHGSGYAVTSKNPIQPNSANSLWWAWNMNRPGNL
jgi:hypothetical protein